MKLTYLLIGILTLVVAGGGVYIFRPAPDYEADVYPSPEVSPVDDTVAWPPEPENEVDVLPIAQIVRVTLKTTLGDIKVVLDGTRAPLTVGSFVKLAQEDFYDGTSWHRVIPDFMIQGGDPLSRDQESRESHGTGGPGYKFMDEINAQSYGLHEMKLIDAVDPRQAAQLIEEAKDLSVMQFYEAQGYRYTTQVESLPLRRGVIAMANSGPNTNGSQFFIVTAPEVPHLQGKHTPFGIVEGGMEVVDQISQVEADERDNPVEPVVIEDVLVDRGPASALDTLETDK